MKEKLWPPRQHIKKQRHYFIGKGRSSQNNGFSSSHVWMWELDHKESWVPKNWCFWTVVLEKTLEKSSWTGEGPWTARSSNQSILKEISPEYSLEGLMLKLNLQYFGHLMWRVSSLEKTLMVGKIEGRSRRGWQRMRLLNGITDLMDMIIKQAPEVGDGQRFWCSAVHGIAKNQTRLSKWTELNRESSYFKILLYFYIIIIFFLRFLDFAVNI